MTSTRDVRPPQAQNLEVLSHSNVLTYVIRNIFESFKSVEIRYDTLLKLSLNLGFSLKIFKFSPTAQPWLGQSTKNLCRFGPRAPLCRSKNPLVD